MTNSLIYRQLNEPLSAHVNSFDALRIVAAVAVVVSHAWQVTGSLQDPVFQLSDGQYTLGNLGVMVFMAISGYLITQSWQQRGHWWPFLVARASRIWPALIVVILAAVLIIGPLTTTQPGYWTHPDTWAYFGNLLLHNPFGEHATLPGVFERNPAGPVVIGTIWTLEYEFACYLGMLLLGVSKANLQLMLPLIAWGLATVVVQPGFQSDPWFYLPLAFAVGGSLQVWQNRVPWHLALALGAALLAVLGTAAGFGHLSVGVFGTYAVASLGRSGVLPRWARFGDPTYGTYLWGMLLQQVVVWAGFGLTVVSNLLICVPLTLLAGYLSWHLVEHWALNLSGGSRRLNQVV